MNGKIIVITGGARSGKSAFAEKFAARQGKKVAYIATAQVYDEEMKVRVELHQKRRPENWQTFEAPYDADKVIATIPGLDYVILFDCLTLYTSNLLLDANHPEDKFSYIMAKIDSLVVSARASQACLVFVTNEVGMGIVPDNLLARQYRDIAGMVNQKMATCADEVYLVVSGLAVELKSIAVNAKWEV